MSLRLRPYQIEAVGLLRNGYILCGVVGSGKSLTAIAYYFNKECGGVFGMDDGEYVPMKKPKSLYIITTARKRDTLEWERELAPFLLSTHSDSNYYTDIEVVVDSWNNIGKYLDVKNSFFIFDEQRLVGYGAWVKSFLKIVKENRWILLSATPGDVWMDYVPVFIANGFYKNKTDFIRQHVVYSRFTKYPKVDSYIGGAKLERLRKQILVNMDYTRKTIRHHKDIFVPYSKDKEAVILKKRWNIYEDEPIRDAGQMFFLLRKLVNSDPRRIGKVEKLTKEHDKMIIFYNFNYELDMLREMAERLKITYAEWNGHKHEPLPKTERWVYLVQYTAGAEGWNCVETDTVVFYSQNYSYKIMTQAAGRIDRLNTPYTDLYYYHLKSKSKIDSAIAKALAGKKNFNERQFKFSLKK